MFDQIVPFVIGGVVGGLFIAITVFTWLGNRCPNCHSHAIDSETYFDDRVVLDGIYNIRHTVLRKCCRRCGWSWIKLIA